MLRTISWEAYWITVMVLVVLWYGFVILRYYPEKLKDIFKGAGRPDSDQVKKNNAGPFAQYNESFSTLEDAEELYHKIVEVFIESNDRGISKTEFCYYLQFILAAYPFVKQSALREKINSLIVLESQKYPDFVLTEAEVDGLWESED